MSTKNGKTKWWDMCINWRAQHTVSIEQRIITYGCDKSTKATHTQTHILARTKKENVKIIIVCHFRHSKILYEWNVIPTRSKWQSQELKKYYKKTRTDVGWVMWNGYDTKRRARRKESATKRAEIFFVGHIAFVYRFKECVNTEHTRSHTLLLQHNDTSINQ